MASLCRTHTALPNFYQPATELPSVMFCGSYYRCTRHSSRLARLELQYEASQLPLLEAGRARHVLLHKDWYEPLPGAGAPSYGAVIASRDGWGAAISSAKPPVEPSTESLLVMAAPPSPVPGEAGGTGGSPVGPSTPPEVVVPVPVGSPAEVEEVPVAVPPPVVHCHIGPTVEPAVLHPRGVDSVAVPDSAALFVSDMTGTETQTPSMAAEGGSCGRVIRRSPCRGSGRTGCPARSASRLQICRYALTPHPRGGFDIRACLAS